MTRYTRFTANKIAEIIKKAARKRGPKLERPLKSQTEQHLEHLAELEANLPPVPDKIKIIDLKDFFKDSFYQLEKIDDQIPLKIEGFKVVEKKKKAYKNPYPVNKYEEQKYEILRYPKDLYKKLLNDISNLHLERKSSFEKGIDKDKKNLYNEKEETEKSLLNIKFKKNLNPWSIKTEGGTLIKEIPHKILFDFLELLVNKMGISQYAISYQNLKKLSFHNIKHLGHFDIELIKKKGAYFVEIKPEEEEETEDPIDKKMLPLDKPEFFYFPEFEYFVPDPNGNGYYIKDLNTDLNFIEWRNNKQKEKKTLDNYLKICSNLLELQDKNPYFWKDEIINAEDYLLETILHSIKKNELDEKLKLLKLKFLENNENEEENEARYTEPEETDETDKESTEYGEYEYIDVGPRLRRGRGRRPQFLYPSEVTSLVLNFFNNRKRNLENKENENLLQIKNLLDKKRKIQTSFLYKSLCENDFDFNELKKHKILDNILRNLNIEKIQPIIKTNNYILQKDQIVNEIVNILLNRLPSKIIPAFLSLKKNIENIDIEFKKESLLSHTINNIINNIDFVCEKYYLQIQKLIYKYSLYRSQKFWNEQKNIIKFDWDCDTTTTTTTTKKNYNSWIFPVRDKMESLFKSLFKKIFLDNLKYHYILNLKNNTFTSVEKFENENIQFQSWLKVLEGDLKFQLLWFQKYFLKNLTNLPSVEEEFDSYLQNILPSKSQSHKFLYFSHEDDHYKYFIRKLPRIPKNLDYPILIVNTDEKEPYPYTVQNIHRMTKSKLKRIERVEEILSIFFKTYFSKSRSSNIENIENIENENFDYFYDLFYEKMSERLIQDFCDYDEINNNYIFQNERFENAIDDVFDILKDEDNDFCDKKNKKLHRFNKPLYQTFLVRKMSGYLYPDNTFAKTNPNLKKKNQITEIPIPNSNFDYLELTKRLQDNSPLPLLEQVSKTDQYKIFKYQRKLLTKGSSQFFELRENLNNYSWSIIFFFTSGWVFVNIFKNVYKKYAKEIVESCIDFLQRAGILDDVQWIKEELGMTPIDKGYRGIRNHGKKFQNIIGLDRNLQVSEMVWFLKTKKLIQSTDPFVHIFIFLSRNLWKTKMQLISKKTKSAQLPVDKPSDYFKPKGFLFTGPPGTGKTLLVQAIAGETGVPVVTQSGGLLQNPRLRGKGAKTLHKLFVRAREIAPCIIFIDEIDGIGARRQLLPLQIYVDIHGRYDPIEFLESSEAEASPSTFQTRIQRRFEFFDDHDPYWKEPEFTQTVQFNRVPIDVLQEMESSRGARNEQLSILTQLLIELDGALALDNILVIGATNRLEILDPALMRPGRLQGILKFNLPDYTARLNLFKLYTRSSKIGVDNISWDYFSKRTNGLSSADIASIVFASELTAVQQSKKHTFETLERGIDLITSFPSDPVMFRLKNIFIFLEKLTQDFFSKNIFYSLLLQRKQQSALKLESASRDKAALKRQRWRFSAPGSAKMSGGGQGRFSANSFNEISNILRNCYYNIGKMLILFCLQMPISYISLWERPKNFRFFFFTFNEFSEFDQKRFSRKDIEKRLLTFFGGKAAESLFIFLPFNKFSPEVYFKFDKTFISISNSLEQSNFGIETEIQTAQSLLKLMVEKWYFYVEKVATEKFHPILEDSNLAEYSETEKEILLAQALVDEMVIDLDMRNRLSKNEQKHSYKAWWMKKIATRLNYRENSYNFLQWSRIYLSDPENSAQNIEWVAPDEYFHTLLRTPPYCMPWTNFLENGRFAISNLLLLQSFNTVFKTLRQFAEFMDFLSDYFLRYECLREKEFKLKIYQFFVLFSDKNKK
uniref:Cell division protein FTSH n=1 Tax=Flabellia petiolata TaxID=189428 RepID=A0A386AX28_9CHLO|nr:Cell division protein FTSH [Flabellia petiolata]